jgi:hypothetical protein
MPDPTLDRAAALLRSGGRIAMTTTELAHALGQPSDAGTVATLERRLADDHRFRLFDTGPGLPGLEGWHPRDRLAYAAALRQVDLPRPPLVLLRDDRDPAGATDPAGLPDPDGPAGPAGPAGLAGPAGPSAGGPASTTSLGRLLHLTVLELAATRSAPSIALAAEAARAALLRVNPIPAGAAPSTTVPPGPRPPARARPIRPPRGRTPPRTPGSPPAPPTPRA